MRRCALLPCLALAWAGACGPPPRRPDVVLVVIDTLRADRTSILPGGPDTTPELAAWAQAGVVYSQAISPATWTLPSMASILAGRPVSSNRTSAFAERQMLAEHFAAAGYRTVGLTANPLLTEDNGFTRGFQRYAVAPAQSTASLRASTHDLRAWDAEALVSRAIDELASAPEQTPVFLYLHLMDPHVPYDAANETLAAPEPGWSRDEGGGLVAWTDVLPEPQTALLSGWRRNYDGQVIFTDRALGRLFRQLAETRSRPALVAVTADHGEGLFSHRRNPDSSGGPGLLWEGYDDHGEQAYEEAVRVPLWLVGPGVPAGRTETRPVPLYDLAGTLLSLAGLPADGRSLPLAAGDRVQKDVFGSSTRGWFLRTAERKLVVPKPNRAKNRGIRAELFEVTGDEYMPETANLSALEARTLREFVDRWEHWMAELAGQSETPVDEATLERMRALGYVR